MTSFANPTLTLPSRSVGARITGVGGAQPSGVVSAASLMAPFGKTAEWLRERTGIRQVRRLQKHEDLLDLAVKAVGRALDDAGIAIGEVDSMIVATCSGSPAGQQTLSGRLAARLGLRAPASDLNSACAGFCYALATAAALIESGGAGTVLVVGAERMSALLDPDDMGTSILFGDGAGAAVVRPADGAGRGIGPAAWSSDGAMRGVLTIPEGRTTMQMAGQQVFRWAVEEVHKVATDAIAKAGLGVGDIEVFVPHQANLRIIDAVKRQLKIGHATTATDIVDSGNTSAASIPIALARLRHSGQAKRGQLALLTGFGAGLSIAAQVIALP
ncbi:MAG TPA: beta-ketoacyl-ACP synthase 3 [Jatrophihabitans sp.]|jgi:3-oxoacyl-[acyl-carrier-protein] synthase-3|uniref:beta-ketoacyl-ACP synthase 3 n=1 Tax=Jatrophihabitans sp. TaxID=1932789 RepID=UPI002DFD7184|nr:beta-ketoacyl-ACP synthase 3 [Jatrophihabitans sp.]